MDVDVAAADVGAQVRAVDGRGATLVFVVRWPYF